MKANFLAIMTLLALGNVNSSSQSIDPLSELREVATQFIQLVDVNDSEKLSPLFHPTMMQYVQLGGNLIPMSSADFIQMVADKKVGGKARKMEIKAINLRRGQAAEVIIHAISDEYDFMYHLSLAKSQEKWVIVSILTDIEQI